MAEPKEGEVVPLETKKDYDDFLKKAGEKLVVIDFYAEWCGPCRKIGPTVKKFAAEDFKDKAFFAKVNVDENAETAEDCEISAMPTFQLMKNGVKVAELTGANENKLKEIIQAHV